MAYRSLSFPMTLRDLQGHLPIMNPFKCIFYRCAAVEHCS